jgi:hypothetical protein
VTSVSNAIQLRGERVDDGTMNPVLGERAYV